MIAGMDVGQKSIVIAYQSQPKPIFEKIFRKDDRKTAAFLINKLKKKGVDKIAFENPEILREDTKISPNVVRYRETMNIILFLEEFEKQLENAGIKAIPIDPRRTSNKCPICNKKLEKTNEDFHYLSCPNCETILHKDEIASWNILNKGIEKMKKYE